MIATLIWVSMLESFQVIHRYIQEQYYLSKISFSLYQFLILFSAQKSHQFWQRTKIVSAVFRWFWTCSFILQCCFRSWCRHLIWVFHHIFHDSNSIWHFSRQPTPPLSMCVARHLSGKSSICSSCKFCIFYGKVRSYPLSKIYHIYYRWKAHFICLRMHVLYRREDRNISNSFGWCSNSPEEQATGTTWFSGHDWTKCCRSMKSVRILIFAVRRWNVQIWTNMIQILTAITWKGLLVGFMRWIDCCIGHLSGGRLFHFSVCLWPWLLLVCRGWFRKLPWAIDTVELFLSHERLSCISGDLLFWSSVDWEARSNLAFLSFLSWIVCLRLSLVRVWVCWGTRWRSFSDCWQLLWKIFHRLFRICSEKELQKKEASSAEFCTIAHRCYSQHFAYIFQFFLSHPSTIFSKPFATTHTKC